MLRAVSCTGQFPEAPGCGCAYIPETEQDEQMVNLHTFERVNTDRVQEFHYTPYSCDGSDHPQTQDCPSAGLIALLHTATRVSRRHDSHRHAMLKGIDHPSWVVRPAPCV